MSAPVGCLSVSFGRPIDPEPRASLGRLVTETVSQVWSQAGDRCHLLFRTPGEAERFSAARLSALAPVSLACQPLPSHGTLDRPVIVIAAPRSGSTLLFEVLAAADELWSLGDESHRVIEGVRALATDQRGFVSDELTAADATAENVAALHAGFLTELRASDGSRYLDRAPDARPPSLRLLEKTPKNSLRVPFLRAAFPGARFIFLYRSPAANLGSIVEAWRSGWFVSRPSLPGWSGPPWSLLLPPGWRALDGRPLEEIAAHQWLSANRAALDALYAGGHDDVCAVDYDDLVSDAGTTLARLCRFAGVPEGARLQALGQAPLPLSKSAVTAPNPDKWRRIAPGIEALLPSLNETFERLRALPR